MISGFPYNNMNMLWASIIIEELVRNGVDAFFASPGARNAPLMAALSQNQIARAFSAVDERAGAFMALGWAKAAERPAAVVCTSGTALSNYFPAVIEAFRDSLPLVIISADRPPELTGSDANQTISQTDLFGRYCLGSLNLPCPDEKFPVRSLAAKIDHLAALRSGPVHINCRFRAPLTPVEDDSALIPADYESKARNFFSQDRPLTMHVPAESTCSDISPARKAVVEAKRGLLVVGRMDSEKDRNAAVKLAQNLDWPVFCDIGSSIKGRAPQANSILTMDHPAALELINQYSPDVILQLGTGLVSKHYYGSVLALPKEVILVSPRTQHRDPSHRVTLKLPVGVDSFVRSFGDIHKNSLDPDAGTDLMQGMAGLENMLQKATPEDKLTFPLIAEVINRLVPDNEALFLGNSIAIRAFDAAIPRPGEGPVIVTNRGVSGIEGNIAVSLGFAQGSGKRTTSVIGDVSFLHDLNSLHAVAGAETPVILVVINNQGGRIFERLPAGDFPEMCYPLMATPHNMDFRHAALQFNLPYSMAETPKELKELYAAALRGNQSHVIEVRLCPQTDLEAFKARKAVRLQ